MAYREDIDLEFLQELDSKDLDDLVYALTKDKDGDALWTEELTSTKSYKSYYPDHNKYWDLIAAELQCFGANSIVTIFRGGKGVLYKEVLTDVADKMKVNYSKSNSTARIEEHLLNKILGDAIEKMSEQERKEFATSMGLSNLTSFSSQATVAAFQALFRAGGVQSFKLAYVVVNAISTAVLGRGLSIAGGAALTRSASLLVGPVGWAITGLWTLVDVAGPAYRVTIPAVIQVAFLRKKYLTIKAGLVADLEEEMNK